MAMKIDMIGLHYGRLRVIGIAPAYVSPGGQVQAQWRCLCVCGTEVVVRGGQLRNGQTQSCGCLSRDVVIARSTTHGGAGRRVKDPLYRLWCDIIKRCENPRSKAYPNYGGRGIRMCERWRNSFATFRDDILAEIGERPADPSWWTSTKPFYTIDRKNNEGHYEPGNVRWSDPTEQNRNTRQYRGDLDVARLVDLYAQGHTTREIAAMCGCGKKTVEVRLHEAGVTMRTRWTKIPQPLPVTKTIKGVSR